MLAEEQALLERLLARRLVAPDARLVCFLAYTNGSDVAYATFPSRRVAEAFVAWVARMPDGWVVDGVPGAHGRLLSAAEADAYWDAAGVSICTRWNRKLGVADGRLASALSRDPRWTGGLVDGTAAAAGGAAPAASPPLPTDGGAGEVGDGGGGGAVAAAEAAVGGAFRQALDEAAARQVPHTPQARQAPSPSTGDGTGTSPSLVGADDAAVSAFPPPPTCRRRRAWRCPRTAPFPARRPSLPTGARRTAPPPPLATPPPPQGCSHTRWASSCR